MNYKELISFCEPLSVTGTPPHTLGNLYQDSRKVRTGDIFIALKGYQTDGYDHIPQAIRNGAAVIIAEKPVELIDEIAVLVVKDTRKLIGLLAQKMAGNPARQLTIIGVTGTNGKTTVATLVWQLLTEMGQKASLLGTIEKRINNQASQSNLTTGDPIELANDMKKMVDAGCQYLAMEVSSHALHQHRVGGIPFYTAVFTNLTHDHLDYHESMTEYASSKKMLFDALSNNSWAIVNIDDPKGEWMINTTPAKVLSFGFRKKGLLSAALVKSSRDGITVTVDGNTFKTPLIGEFNAYNIVQAILTCTALGFDGERIAEAITRCKGAPGRLERVSDPEHSKKQPLILVDYAHTPNALENVSSTLSKLKKEKQSLTILFGCGGDRDRKKRPEMARIAEKYGDRIVVTSDNPRTEDPDAIIREICTGFSSMSRVITITNRQKAIEKVISESNADSVVLIAGKGHETYQEISGQRIHFDDREIAVKALRSKNGNLQNSEVI